MLESYGLLCFPSPATCQLWDQACTPGLAIDKALAKACARLGDGSPRYEPKLSWSMKVHGSNDGNLPIDYVSLSVPANWALRPPNDRCSTSHRSCPRDLTAENSATRNLEIVCNLTHFQLLLILYMRARMHDEIKSRRLTSWCGRRYPSTTTAATTGTCCCCIGRCQGQGCE